MTTIPGLREPDVCSGGTVQGAGQPAAALKEFETALEQTPNRYRTLLGIARAANAAGDRQKASDYYGKVVNLAKNADTERPETREARAFLAGTR